MRRTGLWLCLLLLAGLAAHAVSASYPRAIEAVLKSEGGAICTNHPADPGGPTKYGITIHDVRRYIDAGATADDVCDLQLDQAQSIYSSKYWAHSCVRADALPAGLDYSLFDYGVNAGPSRAGKVLRFVLGLPRDDCKVTDGVVRALAKRRTVDVIKAISVERRQFYENLISARPSSAVFRNGWLARVGSVEAIALRMAGGPPHVGLFGEEIEPEASFGPGKAWVVPP